MTRTWIERTGIVALTMLAFGLAPLAAQAGEPTDFVNWRCEGAWSSALSTETSCEFKHTFGTYAYANGSAVGTSPGVFVWVTKKGSSTLLASCQSVQIGAYYGCSGDGLVNVPHGTMLVCHARGSGAGTFGCGDVLTK